MHVTINIGVYGVKEDSLLAKIYCTMYSHTSLLQSCLLCAYLVLLTTIASLPTAAANEHHELLSASFMEPSLASTLLYTKKRSKHLRLISLQESSGTDFSIFVCSSAPLYPLSFLHPSTPIWTEKPRSF